MSGEILEYLKEQVKDFQYFTSLASSNLFVDPSTSLKIVSISLSGVKECFGTTKYGYLILNIFLNYIVSYIASCIVYFYCIFPVTCLFYSIFFGPTGFLFALAHGAMLCNIVACHETRISSRHFMNHFFTIIVTRNTGLGKFNASTTLFANQRKDAISWRIFLFKHALRLGFFLSKLLMLFIISLIPIFGTILLKLQCSASRGFSYFIPYLDRTKRLNNRCMKVVYYGSFGKWLLFGLTTGLLESIPILAGLSISTNTCACALWEVDHAVSVEDL